MIIVQKIRLDLFLQSRSTVTVAKQGDIDSRFLEATICANGKPVVVPSNSAASLNMTRSDGMTNSTICTCNDDGTVTIPLIQWALALPGDIYCSLSISTESEKLTTLSFRVKVERSEYNENQIVVYSIYETSLDPGTYHIRIAGNSYQFTTSYAVPVGGVIRFNTILTKAYTYSTESLESEIEDDINLVEGTGGTELVTSGEATIINELANEIANKVPITRTINSKSLESNIVLNASDIPNDSSVSGANVDDALDILDDNKVPITRTINSKSLETDIVLNSTDIENDSSIFDGDNISEVFESIDGKIDEVVSDIDSELAQKANVDGYYETLGAGTADQLISPDGVTDTPETDADYNPFVFRPTGGSISVSSGNAKIDQIRGSSIVWNQLVQNGNFTDTSGWLSDSLSTISVVDNICTWIPSRGGQSTSRNIRHKIFSIPINHKVLISFDIKEVVEGDTYFYMRTAVSNGTSTQGSSSSKLLDSASGFGEYRGDWQHVAFIWNTLDNNNNYIKIGTNSTTTDIAATVYIKNVMVLDLTTMFGTTIADYLYELDNSTATEYKGVAEFVKLYPKLYYAYDPGTIKNITASALRTVEFNAWDEQWEVGTLTSGIPAPSSSNIRSKNFCKMLPGVTYYQTHHSGDKIWIAQYDADKEFIKYHNQSGSTDAGSFISDNKCAYFKIVMGTTYGTTYNNDICINLSHSGYRDGEYEPYKTHELSLQISTYFPDGMNGIDTVYDEINFKTRKAIKRFGIVDLGTLTWTWNSEGEIFQSNKITDIKNTVYNETLNCLCPKYDAYVSKYASDYLTAPDKIISEYFGNYKLRVKDTSFNGDVSAFTAAMSGVYLVYELAIPVEIDIPESVNNTYIESDFGTEEFVYSEVDIPIKVPCEIKYIDNLKEKLRNLNPMTTSELNEVLTILD